MASQSVDKPSVTKTKVLFLGHSLAKRFGEYVQETCPNFNISNELLELKVVARGGLKCQNLLSCGRLEEVKAFQPNVVVVQVGDNNINPRSSPHSVTTEIVRVVLRLRDNLPKDTTITVAKIMPRDMLGTSRYLFGKYNELADDINLLLEETLPAHNIIFFNWKFPSPINGNAQWLWHRCFASDGVHLNQSGLKKMLSAFRKIVLSHVNNNK